MMQSIETPELYQELYRRYPFLKAFILAKDGSGMTMIRLNGQGDELTVIGKKGEGMSYEEKHVA